MDHTIRVELRSWFDSHDWTSTGFSCILGFVTLRLSTLSNPAVGETVLTLVKWCCNTGEVPIRIKKRWTNRHLVKNYYFLWIYINVCNKSISAFGGELTYLYNCIWMASYFWLISSNIQSQVGKKVSSIACLADSYTKISYFWKYEENIGKRAVCNDFWKTLLAVFYCLYIKNM